MPPSPWTLPRERRARGVAVLTGADLAADALGTLICGWQVTGKDGEAAQGAGPSRPRGGHGAAHRGRDGGGGRGERTRGARRGGAGRGALLAPSPRWCPCRTRSRRARRRCTPTHPATSATTGRSATARLRTTPSPAPTTWPASTSSTTGSSRTRWSRGPRSGTTSPRPGTTPCGSRARTPHIHRLVLAAFIQIAPEHKLHVIAPRRRWRIRVQDFHLPGRNGGPVGGRKGRPAGQVDRRPLRVLRRRCARTRPMRPTWSWPSTRTAGSSASGSRPSPTWAPISRPSRAACPPTSTAPCSRASTPPRPSTARSRRCSPTRPRWTRSAARDARRRPTSWSASSTRRRARWASTPAELRRRNFIPSDAFPYPTKVALEYDSGNYRLALDRALDLAEYAGFDTRREEAKSRGKLRGIGLSAYIEACGIAPSQVVGSLGAGVGLWESGGIRFNPTGNVLVYTGSHSHGQGHETTFAQLVSDYLGVPLRERRGGARRHGEDPVRHGHLRLAFARGGRLGPREGDGQGHRQGAEDRRVLARSVGGGHRVRRRQLHGGGGRTRA